VKIENIVSGVLIGGAAATLFLLVARGLGLPKYSEWENLVCLAGFVFGLIIHYQSNKNKKED